MQPLVLIAIVLTATLGASARQIPSRIVGGSDAPDGKYPYQASLRWGFINAPICGGSIVNNRWILTSAKCISGANVEYMKVVVGTNLLSGGGKTYQADLILAHPKWDNSKQINDVALLRVSEDIEFNEKVQPIRLPDSDFTKVDYPSTLSGWGSKRYSDVASEHLQHINLTIISQKYCREFNVIDETHICTLARIGQGACAGDTGGPLTADGVQIGIVSYGTLCAVGNPDIYTRVWTFMGWIRETIEQNS